MGRSILVAVDASAASQSAALWAAHNLARPGDSLHIVAIAPPTAYAMTPAAPIASAGAVRQGMGVGLVLKAGFVRARQGTARLLARTASMSRGHRCHPKALRLASSQYIQVAALSLNWEQQRRAEEEQCRALLHEVGPICLGGCAVAA